MRKLAVLTTLGLLAAPVLADWNPGDPYKMHFPQLPDPTGWDVNATYPKVLADDWQCSETGWVKDIHFWGSWEHGITGQIQAFMLSIHSDVPAGPTSFSHPGPALWEHEITNPVVRPIDPTTQQGWYDPNTGTWRHPDHSNYFQYNIILPPDLWFWQDVNTIYWLDISAIVANPTATRWGWKTSLDHWNDDAVWGDYPAPQWSELTDPQTGTSLDMAFVITPEPATLGLLGLSLLALRRR